MMGGSPSLRRSRKTVTVTVGAAMAGSATCHAAGGCGQDPAKVSLTGVDLGQFILPGHGLAGPPLSLGDGADLRAALGSALYLALIGLLALGVATAVGLGVLAAWAAGALLLGGLALRLRDA